MANFIGKLKTIFDQKKQTRRIISEVVILSVVFGFAAGVVGQLVADVYLDPWRLYDVQAPDDGQPVVVPELQRTKRFLGIEQDFQVEQALRQNSATVVGFYRLKHGADVLTQLYQPSELLGNGMLLTSDGWIVTHQAALGDLKAEQLAVVYRNQAFSVLSAVADKMTGVVFLKIAVNNLPVIILGGIYSGVFTPTEAAGVAVIYGFLVGALVYREIRWKDLSEILLDSAVMSAICIVILGMAVPFGWILTFENFPMKVAQMMSGFFQSQFSFMLVINLFFLFWGCVMSSMAALIILTPILHELIENKKR